MERHQHKQYECISKVLTVSEKSDAATNKVIKLRFHHGIFPFTRVAQWQNHCWKSPPVSSLCAKIQHTLYIKLPNHNLISAFVFHCSYTMNNKRPENGKKNKNNSTFSCIRDCQICTCRIHFNHDLIFCFLYSSLVLLRSSRTQSHSHSLECMRLKLCHHFCCAL